MPKPAAPQTPADRLIQHLRDGSALYVRLAARDVRWVAARACVVALDANKKRALAKIALDMLRVKLSRSLTPDLIAALQLDEPPASNDGGPRK